MHFLGILFYIFAASFITREASFSVASIPSSEPAVHLSRPLLAANTTGELNLDECTRLVRRSFYNFLSLRTSPPHSALETHMVDACLAGRSFFNRRYYNCVFAAKYSDTRQCAYAEKGIDLSKGNPLLAARRPGEEGFFEGTAKEMEAAIYRGQDPRTTIDRIDLNRYLDERDNIDRSLGEKPPSDRRTPLRRSASHVRVSGRSYWIVREDFAELQLAKIRRKDAHGSENVLCAQFGNSRRLRIDRGYCGAMIRRFFKTSIVDVGTRRDGAPNGPEANVARKYAAAQKQQNASDHTAGSPMIVRQIPFGFVASGQSIYKCPLGNGRVEYTDTPCANRSQIVQLSTESEQLSKMTLSELRQRLVKLVQRLRQFNVDVSRELSEIKERLGPNAASAALTAEFHRVRGKWDPQLQETAQQMLRVQSAIKKRCARIAASHDADPVCG